VKKLLIPGALALLVAAPAFAESKATLDQVMKDLAALTDRVGRLEQDNTQLKTENATLKAENDRLEATSEYLKDNATATRKQLAQDSPKVAEAERITKGAEWASRISWKADVRYRYESVDPEAVVEQQRQRIRARLAMTAKINSGQGTLGRLVNDDETGKSLSGTMTNMEQITGRKANMVWHKEPELPEGTDFIGIPGGFSYGDYLRSGAMAARSPVMRAVKDAAARGVPVIGICNGFQVLTEAGLLPGALMRNARLSFVCREVPLRVENSQSLFTAQYGAKEEIVFPVAHHDGNYQADEATLDRIEGEGRVAFRYLDEVNGSARRIAHRPRRARRRSVPAMRSASKVSSPTIAAWRKAVASCTAGFARSAVRSCSAPPRNGRTWSSCAMVRSMTRTS